MARADFFEQPTGEHFVVPEYIPYEYTADLIAGVLAPNDLGVMLDPEAGEVEKAEVLGRALCHADPDFREFVQKPEYGVDPSDPLSKVDSWFLAGSDYAHRQAALEEILQDEEFVSSILPGDLELLSVARIEEKQAFLGLINVKYLEQKLDEPPVRPASPESQPEINEATLELERFAANKLLSLLDDNNSFNSYLLGLEAPVDVKKLIQDNIPTTEILTKLEALHGDFKRFVESPTKLLDQVDIPVPDFTTDPKTLREQAKLVRGAIVQRIQKITEDIEQLPARQKLAAAAITGVVAAVTLGSAGSKDSRSPFSSRQGTPAITMVDPRAVKTDTPSELALHRLKIKPTRRIPADKRSLVIATAGEKYAKAVVEKFNQQNGIDRKDYDEDTLATISKMDAIAAAALNLATHRESTTPRQADKLSALASEVMLAARSGHIARELLPQPKPENGFQEEIIRLLEATFSNDPGMDKLSAEEKSRIFGLQARLMDEMAPQDARDEIIGAFIGHLALADGTITEASSSEDKSKATRNHELNELNPKFTLAQLVAAITIIESGTPADPDAENWAGCDGIGQWCYWTDRAAKYLGDPNAPKNTSNQVIMIFKEWNEVLNQLGSGDATAAAWLKGPGFGRAIASHDKRRYQTAIRAADGNGTTILKYMSLMKKYAKTVDVNEQLPFLKEVMRKHPNAMDWSLLDKEWPIHSYHRLRQVKPFTNDIIKKREQRIRAAREQAADRHHRKYKAPTDRSERARAKHIEGAVNLGMHRVYVRGVRMPTRLYAIEGFWSSSQESKPGSAYYIRGAKNRVIVGANHAEQVVKMFNDAKEDGITFQANSSLRKHAHQEDLWHANPNRNEVAPPGRSGHEDAVHQSAIDFNLGKGFSFNPSDYPARDPSRPAGPDNPRVARNSKTWQWLNANAHKYGYKIYWNEPWHVSASGN